ncbi:MAG: hypothetical protein N2517_08450 [Ignavibacteria bacterium]|nr:hypothetical protein [Ignavibacteria bacterium]
MRKLFTVLISLVFPIVLLSLPKDYEKKEKKGEEPQPLRTYNRFFDLQQNSVSNIQFYTTNYGIFGLNIAQNRGGGYWPRGSNNQYIFGGGLWFGAIKPRPDGQLKKYVEVTYNPNSGESWMVPGRITDGDARDESDIFKYRTYFSTDFKKGDGTPLDPDHKTNWPIWDTNPNDTLKYNRYFGYYIDDVNQRNTTLYPKGPAFISGEDIFATYKDTDLSRFEGGAGLRKSQGYPLRLQFEQMIYSWGFGDYKDFIFIKYEVINFSKDTLKECWMGSVQDIDIARAPNLINGARNDRARFYNEDTTLNLGIQWTNVDQGEKGFGFGYLGFDFLESPAVYRSDRSQVAYEVQGKDTLFRIVEYMCLEPVIYQVPIYDNSGVIIGYRDSVACLKEEVVKRWTSLHKPTDTGLVVINNIEFDKTNFIRKDRRVFSNREQLGLKTFRNWHIDDDKIEDEPRYDFMASQLRDGDFGPGDRRLMMATGPFNMLPGDTARLVVALICAPTAVREDADGSTEDVAELVRKNKFAQQVYDDNFRAPSPPERASFVSWTPLNNGFIIKWDHSAEISKDFYEKGMDFLGYRLYRARRTDLDTFDVDNISPSLEYPSGKGPFGWKQIAQWEIPTPFYKSVYRAGSNTSSSFPLIDSLRIVGPYMENQGGITVIDSFTIRVLRVGRGILLNPTNRWVIQNINPTTQHIFPVICGVDTALIAQPWGPFWASKINLSARELPIYYDPFNTINPRRHYLLDSVMLGVVKLNRLFLPYNPLLWRKETINISPSDTLGLPDRTGPNLDTIYLKRTYRRAVVGGQNVLLVDRMVPMNINLVLRDSVHIQQALDSIYKYIQLGLAKVEFPNFEQSDEALMKVVVPYMADITNNRTFYDIGDDNRDLVVSYNDNPVKTEKIINNVDYYYKLLSYDEGDFLQQTPQKLNDASPGLPNLINVFARSAPVGKPLEFTVTYIDTARIGGLYNFKLFATDPDRAIQLFSGRELELEFQPYWTLDRISFPGRTTQLSFGLYFRRMILRDLKTNTILFNGITLLEESPGSLRYSGSPTENAASFILSDTAIVDPITGKVTTFGLPFNNEIRSRSGRITTSDFTIPGYFYSWGFMPEGSPSPAFGVLGFSFDYTIHQFGGILRPDSSSIRMLPNKTPINIMTDVSKIFTTQQVGFQVLRQEFLGYDRNQQPVYQGYGRPIYGSFNNGPGDFEITFLPGGEETMELVWGPATDRKRNTFRVKYLNLSVRNIMKMKRPSEKGDSVDIFYPIKYEHMTIDSVPGVQYPLPTNLGTRNNEFIDKFNISAYGWVNGRRNNSAIRMREQQANPSWNTGTSSVNTYIGTQGRYYLSAVSLDGRDTVDFTHVLIIGGCQFSFDYANKGRRFGSAEWSFIPVSEYQYGEDFKEGDKVVLSIRGGAFGLPLPGAKVRFRISESKPENENYTDEMLEKFKVVPNPYYISHQGQKSPYDAKIYFTKLPPRCTIDIYTLAGDHVRTIEHNETTSSSPDQHSIEVWDLLSKNNLRVTSQTFVAVLRTPNGAQAVQKFSVVVGGFRLIQQQQ